MELARCSVPALSPRCPPLPPWPSAFPHPFVSFRLTPPSALHLPTSPSNVRAGTSHHVHDVRTLVPARTTAMHRINS